MIAEGQLPAATVGDWVVLHYRLELTDGTLVDTSHGKDPMSFLVDQDDQLIEGFHRGAMGMRVKELRRVHVPAHLGYGDRSVGPIPPGSTLIFELERMR